MSDVTMADLTDGTPIRHVRWDMTGKIRVAGDRAEIRWDEAFSEIEVSDDGPVLPEDLEIIKEATP